MQTTQLVTQYASNQINDMSNQTQTPIVYQQPLTTATITEGNKETTERRDTDRLHYNIINPSQLQHQELHQTHHPQREQATDQQGQQQDTTIAPTTPNRSNLH